MMRVRASGFWDATPFDHSNLTANPKVGGESIGIPHLKSEMPGFPVRGPKRLPLVRLSLRKAA
jgi:hypothetical protein